MVKISVICTSLGQVEKIVLKFSSLFKQGSLKDPYCTKNALVIDFSLSVNPLSANPTKWSNTLKQFVGKLPTNCVSVFGDFVKFALKGLKPHKMYPCWDFQLNGKM